ncbi:substrate-binding domain-containing protein [Schlesneria sp. DSM 10557]|uniref:substrate-binding domain-containing protein n=1 Tax=Schlesneria sp. DSM 10557 TaxID=3044399 RepID=UPI0035A0E18C
MVVNRINRSAVLLPVLAVLLLAGVWLGVLPRSGADADTLVVYCAHDRIFAEDVLNEFSRQTGIQVQTRYDTEATKSLGLINLIVQEAAQPRCDVFWNNELLGMVELQQQGLLEAHRGAAWSRIPEQFRDPEGYWVGFAARLRVIIFNTSQVASSEETFSTLLGLEPARVAMAKPLFGTTLTHYTVLWHLWGGERLKDWHRDLRMRGLREVDGNAAVKDIVARGTCDAGLTDTDDVFVALDDGLPVEMLPVRISAVPPQSDHQAVPAENSPTATQYRTVCIPNTVGIIKGTRRLTAAQRLVDFLASAETELALAKSKARQIPLGEVNAELIPAEVQKLTEWARDGVDLRGLLPARRECLEWLKAEYLK